MLGFQELLGKQIQRRWALPVKLGMDYEKDDWLERAVPDNFIPVESAFDGFEAWTRSYVEW